VLVGDSVAVEGLERYLLDEWRPSPYERWWKEAQEADKKTDGSIQDARGSEPDIRRVRLLDCHIVGCGEKRHFNHLLGTGGNVGRRDLSAVFGEAAKLLRNPPQSVQSWLRNTLFASPAALPELTSAGTWFVYANERFNSGQKPSRVKGWISPWTFVFATEGVRLLRGGAGRRLGSRARPYVVFPFLCDAPSPANAGEIKLSRAEFWAPIWEHPANCAELEALLERGLARVGDQVARAPHEFALAARSAGVDSGVAAFVRFSLRQTTSSQVFEAIPGESVRVADRGANDSELLLPVLKWMRFLPEPPSSAQKSKFRGMRGPIERELIHLAERPDDPEQWRSLLLLLAAIQDRVDHNKSFRERSRPVPRLDPEWFNKTWPDPSPEILIARAIASVGAGSKAPLFVNVVGAEQDKRGEWSFPPGRPSRAVYHAGDPARSLAGILERRLIDAEPLDLLPLGGHAPCTSEMIEAVLCGSIELEGVVRWLPAMVLIDWRGFKGSSERVDVVSGIYLLHALFRPFFHPKVVIVNGQPLFREPPNGTTARRFLYLIRSGDWVQAIGTARTRYLAEGHRTIDAPSDIQADGERMAATLLIPMRDLDVATGIKRWVEPAQAKH